MAKRGRTKRTPFDGEGHELDAHSWFGISGRYKTGDQIQILLKGPMPVRGAFMDLRKDAIQLFFDKESREALSSLSLPFTIPDDGHVWIPRKFILEVALGAIKKSTTPKMQVVKDKMAERTGDTPETMREKLKDFLERHPKKDTVK